jgi:hypothetical protein
VFSARVLPLLLLLGCAKSIGDPCRLATDCSNRGDRQCDTSQPDGYCTQIACRANACPTDSSCVLFNAAIAGCEVNPRTVSRTAASQCMQQCAEDGDCRSGYHCGDPTQVPLRAQILDDDKSKRVCLANGNAETRPAAPVCKAPSPGEIPPLPSAAPTSRVDAGPAPDAGLDAAAAADAANDGS